MEVTGLSADTFRNGTESVFCARVVRFLTTLVLVWKKMGSGPGTARWAAMEKEETQSSAPMERLYMERI